MVSRIAASQGMNIFNYQNGRAAVIGALLSGLLASCATGSDTASPQTRLAKAQAVFAGHCKGAGEKIYRTESSVQGVVLLKGRPADLNYGDQFMLDDPYGSDFGGERYVASFLRSTDPGPNAVLKKPLAGYKFVEAIDPNDKLTYRYTGSVRDIEVTDSVSMGGTGSTRKSKEYVLDRILIPAWTARYGITYDDISSPEDREYWIAGSSLKIIDLQTHEVVAERTGYMIDLGQGSNTGARSPWLMAADHACPSFYSAPNGAFFQIGQSARFVKSVLRPNDGGE